MFRGAAGEVFDQNADSVEDFHVWGVAVRGRGLCADVQFFPVLQQVQYAEWEKDFRPMHD